MASGSDPDAPDWFEPEVGDDDLEADAAPPPGEGERSKESTVVHIDDLSPDDVRGGATTAESDQEVDIIEASREDDDEPPFNGEIPGFTDWREELRERLKRIRARREQERADEEGEEQAAAPEDEPLVEETAGPEEEIVATDEAGEVEPVAEEIAEVEVAADDGEPIEDVVEDIAEVEAAEPEEEIAAAPATAGDIIARIVDGPGDEDAAEPDALILGEREAAPAAEDGEHDEEAAEPAPEEAEVIAFSSSAAEAGEIIELDLDAETEEEPVFEDDAMVFDIADEEPEVIAVEHEGDVEHDFGAADEPEGELEQDSVAADVPVVELPRADTEIDDTLSWSEVETTDAIDDLDIAPAAEEEEPDEFFETAPVIEEEADIEVLELDEDEELPAAQMPGPYEDDSAPELEFDEPSAVYTAPTPEIDLAEEGEEDEDHALEWDEEEELVGAPRASSSAAPLGERAAAAVCDALVLTALGVALVGAASSGAGVPFRQILAEELPWIGLTWAIFAFGYSVFLVGACGQTIGRMVMRVRVVGDDQFSVGFGRAARRLGFWVVAALPLLAGMLPALRDPQKRALHDRLSHTRVVKA